MINLLLTIYQAEGGRRVGCVNQYLWGMRMQRQELSLKSIALMDIYDVTQ